MKISVLSLSLGVAALSFLSGAASADAPIGRYSVSGQTVHDTKTNLTWQQAVDASSYSWTDAKAYCASSALSTLLGSTGWRLPTVKELQTVVDYSQTKSPFIDRTYFPNTPVAEFWSASLLAGSSSSAWYVDFFYSGYANYDAVTNLKYVRCVR